LDVSVEMGVFYNPLLLSSLFQISKDVLCGCNGLCRLPNFPRKAKGIHVTVRPNARVFEKIPSASKVCTSLQNGIIGPFAMFL